MLQKIKDKIQTRFPRLHTGFTRISDFYDSHHAILTGFAISFLVAFVAWVGYNQHSTESTVTHIRGDVNVIKQQSSCSPKPNGRPKNKRQCEENFDTIIHKILTPLQACEFLERGSPLIRIGGKPIPRVECVETDSPPSKTQDNLRKPNAGPTPPAASEQHSTSANTVVGGDDPTEPGGSHHSGGGTHGHHGGNPAPEPESILPEGPGNSGGAGGSGESNADNKSEETPASTKLLPTVIGPVEGIVCGVAGKPICE